MPATAMLGMMTTTAAAARDIELFRIVDMSPAARHKRTRRRPGSGGYVPVGMVTLLSGHGGAVKSILALHLAACVAMGLPALGRQTARGRGVLYVSAKDEESRPATT